MGQRGPSRKPTELKIIQGNPGKVPDLGVNEPKPKKIKGARPPKWLGAAARRVWRDVAPKLEALGLLTELDVNMLARYCDVFVRWAKERQFLDEHGSNYALWHEQTPEEIKRKEPPKLKYMVQYPAANLYHQLGRELARLEGQFGMSPASRSSIQVVLPQGKKDKIKTKLYG